MHPAQHALRARTTLTRSEYAAFMRFGVVADMLSLAKRNEKRTAKLKRLHSPSPALEALAWEHEAEWHAFGEG